MTSKKIGVVVTTMIEVFLLGLVMVSARQNSDAKQTGILPGLNIGQPLPEFSLPDLDGKSHSLSGLKGKQGLLLIFISVTCPYSNAYSERMEKIAQDYKARGISFIGINANAKELPEDIKRHAAASHFTFPILKDGGNKLADRLGAQVTPETFLFDEGNKLVYHGRIDNSKNLEMVKSQDLRDALESTLSGKLVERPMMKAFGCTIQRVGFKAREAKEEQ